MANGDRFVLVASNGGAHWHPAWWLNLKRDPRARVQVGPRTVAVVAHGAEGAERERLWPRLKER